MADEEVQMETGGNETSTTQGEEVASDSKDASSSEKDKNLITFEDVCEQMRLIERGVVQKESRYIVRAVRSIQKLRKHLNDTVLWYLLSSVSTAVTKQVLSFVDEPMETSTIPQYRSSLRTKGATVLTEVESFIHLLVVIKLIDVGDIDKAKTCNTKLIDRLVSLNHRSLDAISAKAYFYQSRIYEIQGQLATLRKFLHLRLRTASLHQDEESQSVLLNLLLRNYLHYNLYDQADKLVSKSSFPSTANNCEMARYLFYLGRIRAIQLDYSEAHKHLIQAIRKAPQQSAIGFKQTAQKFAIVVELLLGDIPDRAIFRDRVLKKPLQRYFQLTQAVRNGDLVWFGQVLENYQTQFQSDHTYTLIARLRHNVIKTGLRRISLCYSRISLRDIAIKLGLDNPLDAEYIVAKAIKDGVIEATLNHHEGYMQSKEHSDIYNTMEPQEAFHQRIQFCLDLHTQCTKAMRYPRKQYKESENVEELRETEKQLIEVVKMAENEEEDEEEEF